MGHKIFLNMLLHRGQAMLASSKARLSSSTSPRQLRIFSIYSSRHIQMFVVFRVQSSALRWNRRLSLLLSREHASEADEFIRTVAST